MKSFRKVMRLSQISSAVVLAGLSISANAADKALLDILLENGVITSSQYDSLVQKPSLTSEDFGISASAKVDNVVEQKVSEAIDQKLDQRIDQKIEQSVSDQVASRVESEFPVKVSRGSKGFRLESQDGNWQTNIGVRAQVRYTDTTTGDLRSFSDFTTRQPTDTFENRRLRLKIGGHGFAPWAKYYFELDMQPTRDSDDSGADASTRVIDYRIDLAKYKQASVRLGQWKVDYNRERVDSSGRQQFVERSIVNRIFTIDRQVGAQLRGHLFENTGADLRYWAGVFTGEGRGVRNDDTDFLYTGRLQWNFLGRDLAWKQTDVEYTEQPTASFSVAAAHNTGRCTRWSSSGCGNLDGFERAADAQDGQYTIDQFQQGFAFKYRGLSVQQELHWKDIQDNVTNIESELRGGYVQAGYFFNDIFPAIPRELELAARFAFVDEPNRNNILLENTREEFTLGANWFIAGHNNKITFDYSRLTLDDAIEQREVSDNRFRVQWDVSF